MAKKQFPVSAGPGVFQPQASLVNAVGAQSADIQELFDQATERLQRFQQDLDTGYYTFVQRKAKALQTEFDAANKRAAFLNRTIKEGRFGAYLGEGVDNLKKFQAQAEQFSSRAAVIFGTGTAAIASFVAAASPDAWHTFTGSLQLVSSEIGMGFIPYIREASRWLQDLYRWFQTLSQEQKMSAARWALIGVAAAGVAMMLPRVIGMFVGLAQAIRGVHAAAVFLATNPAWAALIAVGAALGVAFGALYIHLNKSNQELADLQRMERGEFRKSDTYNSMYANLTDPTRSIQDRTKLAERYQEFGRRGLFENQHNIDYDREKEASLKSGSYFTPIGQMNLADSRTKRDSMELMFRQADFFGTEALKSFRQGKEFKLSPSSGKNDNLIQSMQGAQPSYQSLAEAYKSVQLNVLGKDPMQAEQLQQTIKGNEINARNGGWLEQMAGKMPKPAVGP